MKTSPPGMPVLKLLPVVIQARDEDRLADLFIRMLLRVSFNDTTDAFESYRRAKI
jgi:hypothetical protein